jgi:Fe-S oxidoreductase
LIRAALEQREIADPLRSEELDFALSNCLSCRGCTSECPSNVNLPLLKAELLHARIQRDGLRLQQRLFSSPDLLGRIGCLFPRLTNFIFNSRSVRHLFGKVTGLAPERELPAYARERFDRWYDKRKHDTSGLRGRVILWDDTFVRYHEPHIAIAAVKVLEAAGYYVVLARDRKCCGRPAFSQGNLDEARKLGGHNLALLANDEAPIVFLEPSCYSMFAEDYRELNLPGAQEISARCFLFEDFIENLLGHEPAALKFDREPGRVAIHSHCHAKALTNTKNALRLATRLPNRTTVMLDTGCCGMAGAFGMLESKYDLSLKIAAPLMEQIKHQPYGTTVVLSGTSCRHQVQHLATVRVQHMAEVLADALV